MKMRTEMALAIKPVKVIRFGATDYQAKARLDD